MNRESVYILNENDTNSTFSNDNKLPPFPLPNLQDTLIRYYESLKPFGNTNDLKETQNIINNFKNGTGKKLHKILQEKAAKEKNWMEKWWEDYGYMTSRYPLIPYGEMVEPLIVQTVGIEANETNYLKVGARCIYHTLEFWNFIRTERLRPTGAPDGSMTFSSALFKRFINTVRTPGETMDKIISHFVPISEGKCPSHFLIMTEGRIFLFDALKDDDTLVTPEELYDIFIRIQCILEDGSSHVCGVPILTCDERTNWAKNRKHLQELSVYNADSLHLIESSIMGVVLDSHSPQDYSQTALETLAGDYISKWIDKSSLFVIFKNGTFGCMGEHACYDGTISVAFSVFVLLSLMESEEPKWHNTELKQIQINELKFDIDDYLKNEINRLKIVAEETRKVVVIQYEGFTDFGKDYMKSVRIHPDAFIQMALQLAYYRLHEDFVATYETSLMRMYYNGRTETLRACTTDVVSWVKAMIDPKINSKTKLELFKKATTTHNTNMNNARQGKGIDRHLFGLLCAAQENNIEIPSNEDIYSDALYSKSGGNGNFVLSTSTLGYTAVNGCVSPMCLDGYGVFYSITSNIIWIVTTTYRASTKTSAHKFNQAFFNAMNDIKQLIEDASQNSITTKL